MNCLRCQKRFTEDEIFAALLRAVNIYGTVYYVCLPCELLFLKEAIIKFTTECELKVS